MPLSDSDFNEHIAPVLCDGSELNPQEFKHLAGWNYILMQVAMADHYLKHLRAHERLSDPTDDIFQLNAWFVAFLVTYGKCFASTGSKIVKLEGRDVFRSDSSALKTHERIMHLRNTYAAHSGESGIVRSSNVVKDEGTHITVKHLLTLATPTNEFADFAHALDVLDAHVVGRMNAQLDKLQTKLGKPILIE